jgi:Predicted periplasmic protein
MTTIWNKAAALALLAGPAFAQAPCRDLSFDGTGYTVCEAHAGDDLRLFLDDADGNLIGTPERLSEVIPAGDHVVFAMNAGMYHPDRKPVGLFIEGGEALHKIVTSEGPGNFGLLPNGVFCIGKDFSVVESRAFAADPPSCNYATQSGPMLVIDGALHPKFLEDGTSKHIRNGVGVSADGQTAYFAISDAPVTFHEFARLFRDDLKTPNALYLDGKVSRLTIPDQGREDLGLPMGPIVALIAPAPPSPAD